MKTLSSLMLTLVLSLYTFSASFASQVDLEATMKKMKFEVSQAYKAQDLATFTAHIDSFSELVATAKRYPFPSERKTVSLEGLDKVEQAVSLIKQEIAAGELENAKQHLKTIDDLRKEYHKKDKPSVWQKFFG
ncbi:cytochrome b562 [Motilimonas sp. KMU-193]|uniref:cytochrome b562 n=1 Tax=Motilimonas sp. KMU-193 TaxID=3388668 RepID=UPI00396B27D5